ncbi:MAG: carbohydrate-binding family 9-like protein [Candidatus Cloacimonetes bacterium]|nr:carbohydrate-binding family 9-like protein [Candidatus Cloacimonadota bacterium]MDD3235990.1 carbohydrate-binding family 9-like protein [Candidatus Cloacimonadota bacterium]
MLRVILCLIALLGLNMLIAETFPVPKLTYTPSSYRKAKPELNQTCFVPLSYTAHKATSPIFIDGCLCENDWQNAAWTDDFMDIEGSAKPAPYLRTRVKMLYDDLGLLIAAELEEPHLWAKLKERDAVIFYDNDFEVFIDPDGDSHEYYELEFNALGTLWDLFLIKPYRDEHSPLNAWDIKDIQYQISLDGTLNDPSDTDSGWTIEMRIPWKVLSERANMPTPPTDGDYWRINFSRVQWETDKDKDYEKIPNTPEHNWVWTPQGLINMHYPERWGYVFFSTSAPSPNTDNPVIPELEYQKDYLRNLYYMQKQYFMDHGKYAKTLAQLKARTYVHGAKKLKPKIERNSQGYLITIDDKNGGYNLSIRSDGRLTYKSATASSK